MIIENQTCIVFMIFMCNSDKFLVYVNKHPLNLSYILYLLFKQAEEEFDVIIFIILHVDSCKQIQLP